MTLRASKKPAWIIGTPGVAVDVLIVFGARALHEPGLLYLGMLVVLTQAVFVTIFLLPLSLTDDGGWLVVRSGLSQKRVERSKVARCSLVGFATIRGLP